MGKRRETWIQAALLAAGFCVSLGLGTAARTADAAGLSVDDCAKCHEQEPAQIDAKGAAHKSDINCLDCHEGHRPKVARNIPECSACHSGTRHFELEECISCHNPHAPLDIALEGELTAVCLTCHESQGRELTQHASAHTDVSCNFCHADQHGVIPDCVSCHSPHSSAMTQADCATCHQAHMPLALSYGPQTSSIHCAACHDAAHTQLLANQSKHRDLSCVACHESRHKFVPLCTDCHGTPHAPGMHQKFPQCGDCHSIAHDLNNW